jgi:hypothetical protein
MKARLSTNRASIVDKRKDRDFLYILHILRHLDEMGDWPQRLLHAPTMTSHTWQRGNFYNGHKEPKYHAISDTWGRWRLSDKQMIDVRPAVQALGVDWDIPRIDPVHFTDAQLLNVIREACKIDSMSLEPVEFVWLDLSCNHANRWPWRLLHVGTLTSYEW